MSFASNARRALAAFVREWIHPSGPHIWRWRLIQVWIVIFTIVVIFLLRDNRHAISDLNRTKASVAQLEATNCKLKKFLIKAEEARISLALSEKGIIREKDLEASRGYANLARTFGSCSVPIPPVPSK